MSEQLGVLIFSIIVGVLSYASLGALLATNNDYRRNKFCFVLLFWPLVFLIKVTKGFFEIIKDLEL